MSYISEMITHGQPGVTYFTTATADEIYNTWEASGRGEHYSIVVTPCICHEAFEVRLVEREPEHDEYSGDMLQAAFALVGIVLTICVIIGWSLS